MMKVLSETTTKFVSEVCVAVKILLAYPRHDWCCAFMIFANLYEHMFSARHKVLLHCSVLLLQEMKVRRGVL